MSPIVPRDPVSTRVVSNGKFLGIGEQRFLVKDVAYGTFAPDRNSGQFPTQERVWAQHLAFLHDRRVSRDIRRNVADTVRALGSHPAVLLFALGSEIPPGVVRWHGRRRVERFLRDLYDEATAVSPDSLLTYVNYPPRNISTSRSSTCVPSTSTCIRKGSCVRTWRACITSRATSRCCWPRRVPTASARERPAAPSWPDAWRDLRLLAGTRLEECF